MIALVDHEQIRRAFLPPNAENRVEINAARLSFSVKNSRGEEACYPGPDRVLGSTCPP